jgi:hypothetical protein
MFEKKWMGVSAHWDSKFIQFVRRKFPVNERMQKKDQKQKYFFFY